MDGGCEAYYDRPGALERMQLVRGDIVWFDGWGVSWVCSGLMIFAHSMPTHPVPISNAVGLRGEMFGIQKPGAPLMI